MAKPSNISEISEEIELDPLEPETSLELDSDDDYDPSAEELESDHIPCEAEIPEQITVKKAKKLVQQPEAKEKKSVTPGAAENARPVQYLLPTEIKIDRRFDVRPYATLNGNSEAELERISELAASIEKDGQINSALVTFDPEVKSGKAIIVAGHRRLRAVSLINEARTAKGKSLLRLRVEVLPFASALQIAIVDNIQRQDMSPLDIALLAKRLREENGWQQVTSGAIKVANFMRISKAAVFQAEKLDRELANDKDTKLALHEGVISAETAFKLIAIESKADRKAIIELGAAVQQEKAAKTGAKPEKKTLTSKSGIPLPQGKSSDATSNAPDGKKQGSTDSPNPKKQSKIESPAINEAIREIAPDKAPKRTRKEIVEFFTDQDAPVNGFSNGAIRTFAKYFAKWVDGTGTDRTLQGKFDEMVAKADKGTKTKADE